MKTRAIVVEGISSNPATLGRYCARCERKAVVEVGLTGMTLLPFCAAHGRTRERELRMQRNALDTVAAITPLL